MARAPDDVVGYSIFDRLTDEDPKRPYDESPSMRDQIQSFKRSVARDLAFLLNNRKGEADIPEAFEQTREFGRRIRSSGLHRCTDAAWRNSTSGGAGDTRL